MLAHMRAIASRRGDNENAASAVEYGLLVALIAAVIVLAVFALGSMVRGSVEDTCEGISNPAGEASAEGAKETC